MKHKSFRVSKVNEDTGIKKLFFWLLFSGSINRSHRIVFQYKSLLGGKNIQNVGYQFKGSRKLLNILPKLRPGALATRLLIKKYANAEINST